MDFFEFVIALVAIGGTFVTIWVVVLYQRKEKKQPAANGSEYDLRELSAIAQSLTERIDTLESILDAEVPGWREQNEQRG